MHFLYPSLFILPSPCGFILCVDSFMIDRWTGLMDLQYCRPDKLLAHNFNKGSIEDSFSSCGAGAEEFSWNRVRTSYIFLCFFQSLFKVLMPILYQFWAKSRSRSNRISKERPKNWRWLYAANLYNPGSLKWSGLLNPIGLCTSGILLAGDCYNFAAAQWCGAQNRVYKLRYNFKIYFLW